MRRIKLHWCYRFRRLKDEVFWKDYRTAENPDTPSQSCIQSSQTCVTLSITWSLNLCNRHRRMCHGVILHRLLWTRPHVPLQLMQILSAKSSVMAAVNMRVSPTVTSTSIRRTSTPDSHSSSKDNRPGYCLSFDMTHKT